MAAALRTELTDSIPVHDGDGAWHLIDEYTAYDRSGRAAAIVYRRGDVDMRRINGSEFEDPATGEVLRRIAPSAQRN